MKLPAYPRTKPSGVEWLGDVPEHWEVKRLRFVAGIQTGNTPSKSDDDNYSDEGLMWVKPDDLSAFEAIANTKEYLSETGLKLCRPIPACSPLVCCIGTVGKFGFSRDVAATNQQINAVVFQPNKVTTAFGLYLIAATEGEHLSRANKNVVSILNTTQQSNIVIPVPDPAEQRAIAAFLDRETGRVDQLVAKKRELIERLKEKRTALISRTVTRGLPPAAARAAGLPANPFLKPSALHWLGDIPQHWDIKPVKFVAQIGNGSTPSRDNPNYWEDGDYPWLNSSVVNQETITEAEEFVTTLALRECHLPKIAPPAVLIGITGQGRTRGMASMLMFEATINQHVAYLKPYPSRAEVGFLRRVFDMVYLFLRSESDGGGSTKGAITCEQIANLKIPLPPLPEQAAIAAYLDKETAKLDALVGKVEEAVERLQEYRTALITAAVTGKIDVRGIPKRTTIKP